MVGLEMWLCQSPGLLSVCAVPSLWLRRLWAALPTINASACSHPPPLQQEGWLFMWFDSDRTRGNGFELKERRHSLGVRKKLFIRAMGHWKSLPRDVMDASSLVASKTRLDGGGGMDDVDINGIFTLCWWVSRINKVQRRNNTSWSETSFQMPNEIWIPYVFHVTPYT